MRHRTPARALELRDNLKRRQVRETLGQVPAVRQEIVRQYAILIDRANPCRRFFIGGADHGSIELFTPCGSYWRFKSILREYPELPFSQEMVA